MDDPDLSIINEIVCDLYGIESWQISMGYCFIWSYLVKLIFPETILQYNHKHAWVCIDGEYFDARYYLGAPAPQRLSMWGVIETDASLAVFTAYWCEHGKHKAELKEALTAL